MVHGLEHFSKQMGDYRDHYILVGGVAGDLLMFEIGGEFRATKDLDIVVFMRPNPDFLKALAGYIKNGEYANREKSDGVSQHYRFNKPKKSDFPKQIELFSKKPEDLVLFDEQHIIPLKTIESGDQFSGILLEDEYYDLIQGNAVDGAHCKYINAVAQIPLKARAFNELRERKEQGGPVDDSDIRKHRNDILLLSQALPIGGRLKILGLPLAHLKIYLEELTRVQTDIGIVEYCKNRKLGSVGEIISTLNEFYT